MASAGIMSAPAAAAFLLFQVFTSVSGDETDALKRNLGQAIAQISGRGGDWLRPGQPVLIWPLDESALPALLDGREYHFVDDEATIYFISRELLNTMSKFTLEI